MAPIMTLFQKLRVRRTVLRRTRPNSDYPVLVLYADPMPRERSRRLIDQNGDTHELPDKVIESNYKIVSKAESKKLIKAHWENDVAPPIEPIVNPDKATT